uniref:Nuclear VCP like n=1 Tax=Scleropages formosus TaxID=113540 RepID=A0A8D0CF48_SCLFO
MKNRSGSGVDKRLRQRVEQYLSTHDSQYVDLVTVAADLQKLYRMDYGRRNKTAFRIQVEKVYGVICGESGIVGLENKHLAKRFTNHMNNSLMSLYRKGAPESGTPQREKPTGGSVANSTAVSATKVSSGGWFIDKGRGAEDDNILIDLCEEDAGSPVQKQTDVSMLEAEKKPKKNRVKRGKRRKEGELLVADGVIESSVKDAKARTKAPELQHPSVTFEDIGGNEEMLKEVCKLLIHMRHPEVYQQLGVVPPRGFLLHGPPGCGKTLLAHAVAGEMALPLLKVSAPELVSGVSGESEQKLRELFEQAVTNAPCILFIDEIDAITPKREVASKDMERRIVAQLLTCMDDLNSLAVTAQVLVIGATNRPDSLDPALRRAGRFDREVCLGIPDEGARLRILKTLCRKLTLPTDFDFQLLARLTPGYVGADLMALCREAAMNAVNRALFQLKQKDLQLVDGPAVFRSAYFDRQSDDFCLLPQDELCSLLSLLKSDTALSGEQLSNLCILMSDFQESLSCVQPSAKREGFATVPDVTWADIGALQDIREELTMAILAPVRSPEQFKALGLTAPAGVLLAGPPGCGKTLLAKAVANESGLNFISVKGPELLNMYVGESERAVRQIDALCPRRSGHESGASVRVVNQLLTEMDGLETRRQVFIMAATNRPDIIDPAVLRPGRLDKTLYVGLPLPSDRHAILLTVTKGGMRPPLEADVNLEEIAYDERCDCFTGADLSALVREASVNALRAHLDSCSTDHTFSSNSVVDIRVSRQNFEDAFKKVRPSVSKKDQRMYEQLKDSLMR